GRGRVDEAAAALDDAGQTLRRRRRRGQEDPVEIIAVGGGQPVVGLVRDEIGGDDSASAGGVEAQGEVGHAVLEHEVPVAHDHGGAACLGDGLDGGAHVLRAQPWFESRLGGTLDDGTVHAGIRIGYPDLDDVDA